MKPSEQLAATRENLERYGWLQGRAGNPNEGFCLLGAAWSAREIGSKPMATWGTLSYVAEALGMGKRGIGARAVLAAWNDNPARTKTDVLDALVHAEKLALEDEGEIGKEAV